MEPRRVDLDLDSAGYGLTVAEYGALSPEEQQRVLEQMRRTLQPVVGGGGRTAEHTAHAVAAMTAERANNAIQPVAAIAAKRARTLVANIIALRPAMKLASAGRLRVAGLGPGRIAAALRAAPPVRSRRKLERHCRQSHAAPRPEFGSKWQRLAWASSTRQDD